MNAKGGRACIPNALDVNDTNHGLAVQNCNNDLGWMATATAKVGYAWDRVLVYGKAGGAWADNKLDVSCNGDPFFPQGGCIPANTDVTGVPGVQNLTLRTNMGGWTVGAGFELALTPAWSAKAEYNYMNFGSKSIVLADTTLVSFKQDFNQVKVGINYHFGKDDVAVAAAPLPVKAGPAALFNWTGVYVGAAVADRLSVANWNTTAIGDDPAAGKCAGNVVPPGCNPDVTTTPATFSSSNPQGRLYAGYNWQFSPKWVAGVEGDVGNGDSRMTVAGIPGTYGNGVTGTVGIEAQRHDSASMKMGWDGTIRGKLGMLVTPTILFYGTGGAAFQQIRASAACDGFNNGTLFESWCFEPQSQSFSSIRAGWTLGLGIEGVLSGNWLGKVEARYADFGRVNNTFFAGTVDEVVTSVHVQTFTALAGVSYKFGPTAVVAKY